MLSPNLLQGAKLVVPMPSEQTRILLPVNVVFTGWRKAKPEPVCRAAHCCAIISLCRALKHRRADQPPRDASQRIANPTAKDFASSIDMGFGVLGVSSYACRASEPDTKGLWTASAKRLNSTSAIPNSF